VLEWILILVVSTGVSVNRPAEMQSLQQSHIKANGPMVEDFDRLLRRDLLAHFSNLKKTGTRIEYELLREGATQTGIAYPKFYLWVRVVAGAALVEEGAVRVAAVQRQRFNVTDYLPRSAIVVRPEALEEVFPAPVCERIRSKLGLRKT
jgi:hypothetical protein